MRNVFYSVVNDISFKERYMEAYKTHADHIHTVFSIICGLSSAFSVFAWTRWTNLKVVWSLILVLAQVAQIVRSYLPYSRRLDALKYLIPEMHQLVIEVESQWYKLEALENPDYLPFIDAFRSRMVDLDIKYLGADPLPDIRRLRSKAENATKNHLALYVEIMEGGDEGVPVSETEAYAEARPGAEHT